MDSCADIARVIGSHFTAAVHPRFSPNITQTALFQHATVMSKILRSGMLGSVVPGAATEPTLKYSRVRKEPLNATHLIATYAIIHWAAAALAPEIGCPKK